MDQIEKTAHALAVQTVYVAEMKKQAQGGLPTQSTSLEDVLTSGALGALVGGVGTGVISSLAGRRREDYLRDILLGTVVGGVGGAAIPYAKKTFFDEPAGSEEAAPTPGVLELAQDPAATTKKFVSAQPGRAATIAGAGLVGERLSRWSEMQKSLAPEIQQYAQKFRASGLGPKKFKASMKGVRRMPGLGRMRGLGVGPTKGSLKGGGWSALAALLLGLGANK